MKNKMNKLIFDILAIVLFAGIIFVVLTYSVINPQKLKTKDTRYTIAVITDFFFLSDGPRSFSFLFKVDKKIYKGSYSAYGKNLKKGDTLIVKFLQEDPSVYELMFNYSLSDSVTVIPEAGWKQLP